MALTARQLNRATLARQLLLERARLDVPDAVCRVVALQAQEPASPYIALWNRLSGFDAADLDRAFAQHEVVKATLMRVTLHAVHADDYPVFHEAMQPTLRGARLNDRRFRRTGLTPEDADALVPNFVEYTREPRTNAEVEAFVREHIGDLPEPGIWWALRQQGPFVHAPTGATWSFGPRPSYRAAKHQRRPGNVEASLQQLIRRYLEGFGPASIADFAQFGMVPRSLVRPAFNALEPDLEQLDGPGGATLYDVPGAARPADDVVAPPRLLGMWDSVLLAYNDRSRIIPPHYRKEVIRNNGDSLPTLLVDGSVAGVWRPVDGRIEVTAFHRLGDADWAGLEDEARKLLRFLEPREPSVYRRYSRWWSGLPAAEVRMLPV